MNTDISMCLLWHLPGGSFLVVFSENIVNGNKIITLEEKLIL